MLKFFYDVELGRFRFFSEGKEVMHKAIKIEASQDADRFQKGQMSFKVEFVADKMSKEEIKEIIYK
jgi:hypothetical protein